MRMKAAKNGLSLVPYVQKVFRTEVYGIRDIGDKSVSCKKVGAILYALRVMGVDNIRVEECDGNLRSVLLMNDIAFREIELPGDVIREEYPPILIEAEDECYVLFRYRRKALLYKSLRDTATEVEGELSAVIKSGRMYEIYPGLPEEVQSSRDLIPVAFGGEWPAISALLLASGVVAVLSLSIPLFTNYVVKDVIPSGSVTMLWESMYVVGIIIASVIASQFLQARMILRLETTSDLRLQTAIWDRVLKLPMSILSAFTPADVVSRVDGITKIRGLLSNSISSSAIQAIFSVLYLALMFVFDKNLAFVTIGLTSVYLGYVTNTTIQAIKHQKTAFEKEADATEFTYQSVVGYSQIKTSIQFGNITKRWIANIVDSANAQRKSNYYIDNVSIANGVVLSVGNLFIFSIPVYSALMAPDYASIINISTKFITFYSAYTAFFGGVIATTSMLSAIAPQVAVYWRRASPIVHAELETGRSAESLRRPVEGNVEFRNLSYRFDGASSNLFEDLSLKIVTGQNIAITGESGCGKTTLVRLLLGLVEPNSGSIVVDGVPLHRLSITNFRRQVGCVMQDIKLPPGSIGDIVKGSIDYTDEQIWHALDLASFGNDVRNMPMGLNTIVTSGGATLSGGQRQRLCIARALIKQPRLLILDEATSALDNQTQQSVTEIFDSLGITRIVIAHRLSTIKGCDYIYIIGSGGVVEDGTWEDLATREGSYIYNKLRVNELNQSTDHRE